MEKITPNHHATSLLTRCAQRFCGLCLGSLDLLVSQKKFSLSHAEPQRKRFPIDSHPNLFLTNLMFMVPEWNFEKMKKLFDKSYLLNNSDSLDHLGDPTSNSDGDIYMSLDKVQFYWLYFVIYLRENIHPGVSERLIPLYEGYFIFATNNAKNNFAVEIIEPRYGSAHLLLSQFGDSKTSFSESVLYYLSSHEILPRLSAKIETNKRVDDRYGNSAIPFGVGCMAANDHQSRCIMVSLPPN